MQAVRHGAWRDKKPFIRTVNRGYDGMLCLCWGRGPEQEVAADEAQGLL